MSSSRSDRWSSLDSQQAVADAVERLQQMAHTGSERQAMAQWLEVLAPRSGDSLLDVGAGIGDMSLAFARRMAPAGSVHALDLAPGLLDYAARRARAEGLSHRLHLQVGDARDMPFRAGCFDAAFCQRVLLHLPNPERALAEMCRVVRPGGRILCVEVDWATLRVEPGDPEITDQIVQANVARQVDGRSGYRLPALMRSVGLEQLSVTPHTATDASGDWLPFLESRLSVARESGVSEAALSRWWQAIQAAVEQGKYRFSFIQYGVMGSRPHQSSVGPVCHGADGTRSANG